jgi:predicted O-linked N-acetylglucosamine transferase (SPINDLY family)
MARRCGASFLQSMRLSSLLARTPEEYVEIASLLARSGPGGRKQHLGTLKRIRSEVERQRGSSPLFDTDLWVSHFQRMLRSMWETAHATGSVSGKPSARHLVLSGHTGWAT